MRKIRITETQYKLLEETFGLSDSKIKEFPGSEISTTTNVTDVNGEIKQGKPTKTDDVASNITAQSFYGNLRGKGGRSNY